MTRTRILSIAAVLPLLLLGCAADLDTGYQRLGCDGFGKDVPTACHQNVCDQYQRVNSSGQMDVVDWGCLTEMRECCDATPEALSACTQAFLACRGE